jgi:hypothetical protein
VTNKYRFIIGSDPYAAKDDRWCEASTLKEALGILFSKADSPEFLTGRKESVFLPGVSLPLPSSEVIQVWSDNPKTAERSIAFQKQFDKRHPHCTSHHFRLHPHRGDGVDCGVECEIPVTEIARYRENHLLSKALPYHGDSDALSPLGQLATKHREAAIALKDDLQRQRFLHSISVESMRKEEQGLREKSSLLSDKIHTMELYLDGVHNHLIIHDGQRADHSKPYLVFQKRLFLDEEMAPVLNFSVESFDFDDVGSAEAFLGAPDNFKQFLPYDKMILVTRIKRHEKDYGDPFINAMLSSVNRSHIVWIRDGDRVIRAGCDISFSDQIFPSLEELTEREAALLHKFYAKSGDDYAFGSKTPFGEIHPDWNKRVLPFNTRLFSDWRPTFNEWMSKPQSVDRLNAIQEVIREYVREEALSGQGTQIKFLIFLQGLADQGDHLLSVPKGVNLMDDKIFLRYFKPLAERHFAITDPTLLRTWDAALASVIKGTPIRVHMPDVKDPLFFNKKSFQATLLRKSKRGVKEWRSRPSKVSLSGVSWMPLPETFDRKFLKSLLSDRLWKESHRFETQIIHRYLVDNSFVA